MVHDPEGARWPTRNASGKIVWANPRLVFNLQLTPEKRAILPDWSDARGSAIILRYMKEFIAATFAMSFVEGRLDESCRPLIFGHDEIQPYLLRWNGKYIRLNAVPQRKTKERMQTPATPNGMPRTSCWCAAPAIMFSRPWIGSGGMRATTFSSSFPSKDVSCGWTGYALLNSPLMTWYFRAIEPRGAASSRN